MDTSGPLAAFEIRVGNTVLDYRIPGMVDLSSVRAHFSSRYDIVSLTSYGRHVTGVFKKDGIPYFFKLATTEGISELTKNECAWEKFYHAHAPNESVFLVPHIYESGLYDGRLFYTVSDYIDGTFLSTGPHERGMTRWSDEYADLVIDGAVQIASFPVDEKQITSYIDTFIHKVNSWFDAIPQTVRRTYDIERLKDHVERFAHILSPSVRHGDYTPWHMLKKDETYALIDGEHFSACSVQYYDIVYFIQRLYAILGAKDEAMSLLHTLSDRGYDKKKLGVVLAARTIGGYLDHTLASGSYERDASLSQLVLSEYT